MTPQNKAIRPRKTTPNPKSTAEGDHRKRPRNRTTQSCLNCHTAKRMCDRRRPACSRCVQLGLTGVCAYEVDDPKQLTGDSTRLLRRVGELEEIIRELKNKPHPRWLQSPSFPQRSAHERPDPSESHSASPLSPNTSPSPASSPASKLGISDTSSLSNTFSSDLLGFSAPTSSIAMDAPLHGDFPFNISTHDLHQGYDYLTPILHNSCHNEIAPQQGLGIHPTLDHCGCLYDPASYQAMLELSLRLRKASDVLGQSPVHRLGDDFCYLHQRILELDLFAMNTLGSPIFCNSHPTSHANNQETTSGPPRFWNLPTPESSSPTSEDASPSFMNWKPRRPQL